MERVFRKQQREEEQLDMVYTTQEKTCTSLTFPRKTFLRNWTGGARNIFLMLGGKRFGGGGNSSRMDGLVVPASEERKENFLKPVFLFFRGKGRLDETAKKEEETFAAWKEEEEKEAPPSSLPPSRSPVLSESTN